MTAKSRFNRPNRRRSIYILPNIFTTLGLFFGFYSVLASVDGRFDHAAWYILFAALCDGLDGTVARITNTTSQFGVEYDSLCDLVAFGLAPAIMVYFWALTPDNLTALAPYHLRLGAAFAFIFLACGALRLARFNVFSGSKDPGFFQGLPIPGGALLLAATVLWHYRLDAPILPNGPVILALVLTLAFLMVSNIDYMSHKNKTIFRNHRPFETLFVVVLLLGFIVIKLKSALLPIGFIYLLSGPLVTIYRVRARSKKNESMSDLPPKADQKVEENPNEGPASPL